MKSKDFANKYGLDSVSVSIWLPKSGYQYKSRVMGGLEIADGQNIDEMVHAFKTYEAEQLALMAQEEERLAHENANHEAAEQRKQQAIAGMLITSGFSFDGYTITKYSGYISGDDVIQIDRGSERWFSSATDVGAALMQSLTAIRRNALAELKEAAHALGCNAVIGVDFDYLTLDPETVNSNGGTLYLPYVFGVTANGNAVIIEKNDSTGLSA